MVLIASRSGPEMGTCEFVKTIGDSSVWTHHRRWRPKIFMRRHWQSTNACPRWFPTAGGTISRRLLRLLVKLLLQFFWKKVTCQENKDIYKPSCFAPGELKCEFVDLSQRFRCEKDHPGWNELTVTPEAYCRSSAPSPTEQKNTCFLKSKTLDRPQQAEEPFIIYLMEHFDKIVILEDCLKTSKSDLGV